jgi:hypothetical protein
MSIAIMLDYVWVGIGASRAPIIRDDKHSFFKPAAQKRE